MTTVKKDDAARAQLEPLLTVEDLERLLQVDNRTIIRLCKKGRLPAPIKVGHANRWKPDEVARALDRMDRVHDARDRQTEEVVTVD
jgi:predicted DNA-binding transcriptional regulator AlpA